MWCLQEQLKLHWIYEQLDGSQTTGWRNLAWSFCFPSWVSQTDDESSPHDQMGGPESRAILTHALGGLRCSRQEERDSAFVLKNSSSKSTEWPIIPLKKKPKKLPGMLGPLPSSNWMDTHPPTLGLQWCGSSCDLLFNEGKRYSFIVSVPVTGRKLLLFKPDLKN